MRKCPLNLTKRSLFLLEAHAQFRSYSRSGKNAIQPPTVDTCSGGRRYERSIKTHVESTEESRHDRGRGVNMAVFPKVGNKPPYPGGLMV